MLGAVYPVTPALISAGTVALIALLVLAVSIGCSMATASYARSKGFPYWPILIAALFISFPIVLLVVAVAPRRPPDRRW